MNQNLKKLLLIGVTLEAFIFLISQYYYPEIQDTFRYAARLSGRLSAFLFLLTMLKYIGAFPNPVKNNEDLRNFLAFFAVMHVIHFGYLSTCVILNKIELVPAKLAGGALAYLMIVIAPFTFHKIKRGWHFAYFIFVGFVMIMTYVARIKGDFEGADPFWFHYLAISIFILVEIVFIWVISTRKKSRD